jgi:hypothetical protein
MYQLLCFERPKRVETCPMPPELAFNKAAAQKI